MSDVRVTEAHSLSAEDAIARIKSFEEMLTKYGVKTIWKGTQAELKGTGVSGSINVSSSAVDIVVKLGLLAKAAGVDSAKLEKSIRRRLGESLRGTTA
jgi:putative polyhydroxyalkanoate system protein